ncbi:MAG: hypothetical protein V3S49_04440 [Thermodesulfobacteriota bacterium]
MSFESTAVIPFILTEGKKEGYLKCHETKKPLKKGLHNKHEIVNS